ncbi:protein O-GlcNAc transferase [Handroanthus impetiginosus]|uniref:Protein O-GlcNAc transferase n=1 Tax=Handroanthus impetiginosus TaxID=429701 RepID=A0A2G9GW14_9LAMI|nr:protein O-GlcNAc transferase [Handroanthus impetiginosus]
MQKNLWKMEKEQRRLILRATPILFLLVLPFFCLAFDFFWGNRIPVDRWMNYFSSTSQTSFNKTLGEQEFIKFHLRRLVRGEDRRNLDETGFACDRAVHSIVCVSDKPVRIDTTRNVTVYIPSDQALEEKETVIRPYAKQEDELKVISPVRMLQYINTTVPPACQYEHKVPAVIFSSGSTGNVFHEMNEIIIPLFITTKQFQSRVVLILEDYKPSFMTKYGKVLSKLSAYEVINPAANQSVHCFPGSVVGLKYHDNLALNSSDIPGGYAMPDFRHFLRQAYGLKFTHVSQITKPRLMLLSRTNTRRFLNEEEMISLMKEIGFQVIVIRRSKVVSDLNKFSQLINSCNVLVGAHGAGLTNEIFLPSGAVMIQVELIGTEWASNTYYGDTAHAMGVRYLRYKIEPEESSLVKLYGRNHSVITDQGSVYKNGGYRAARTIYLDQQNVRVNLVRFRETLVEALSIVTDWKGK